LIDNLVNTQANIKGNSPMSVQSGNAYNGKDACEWRDRQQCVLSDGTMVANRCLMNLHAIA